LAVGVWLLLSLMCVGCSTLGMGGNGTDRIKNSGQLRVGMSGDYPPLNAKTSDGYLIGFEADLAAALAAILRVELVLVEMPLGDLLDAVADGKVDVAISGLTMTPLRNLDVAFAGPYYIARKTMLASPEILAGVENVAQLRGRGLRVAAIEGGTSEELVKRTLPKSTHLFVADQGDAVDLVVNGDADILIADDPVARFALLRNPGTDLILVESSYSAEPIGIAIAPEDHLFVNLVENYLSSLEQIGLLEQLRTKWFENNDWVGRLE
jgi:polar amino acid transport system substrate-binding protein